MLSQEEIYKARILAVDDSAVNLAIIEKILQKDGYLQVETTTDPTCVAKRHRQNPFDVILLDIHMPVMTGFDVMAALQRDNSDDYLPILVLTADHTEGTRHLCLASGAKDFVSKPFERLEVLFRVRNIIEVRLLHNKVLAQNDTLEQRVHERTEQLAEAQMKLIECLGKAAEFRDNETGMHVVRMSRASGILARAMGLPERECELILLASPMHDVGKIAIPDDVLLKPGKLQGDEWQRMKTHAEIGAEILEGYDTELMQVAAKIARTHHERWDGGGYPAGLKGAEIPLHTRIVSVCDVFDALTSKRPYKEPWSVRRSLDYLRSESGKHFDPDVVQAFNGVVDQVVALRQEHPDAPGEHLQVVLQQEMASETPVASSYLSRHFSQQEKPITH